MVFLSILCHHYEYSYRFSHTMKIIHMGLKVYDANGTPSCSGSLIEYFGLLLRMRIVVMPPLVALPIVVPPSSFLLVSVSKPILCALLLPIQNFHL
jgi:hypothetical protein